MHRWRLIDSGPGEASINMAIDEAIALACQQGQSPPTLRFYTWQPPALSIGYFQDVRRDIDLVQCKAMGYGFVRRLTGGKAVLHDQELTYSIAASADHPLFPKDLRGSFLTIARALVSGLNEFGIEADVFRSRLNEMAPNNYRASSLCFTTALGFEIGAQGKKLIGSAQRRWKHGILQHGSILCEFDPKKLIDLLKFSDENQKVQAHRAISDAVISLSSILKGHVDLNHLKEVLIKGFRETLNIQLSQAELTPFELDLANSLAKQKYRTDSWNLQRQYVR